MSESITYDIPDGATGGLRELLDAVRAGRDEAVPELVGVLTDAERRTCLPVLKSWRTNTSNNVDDGHLAIRAALLLAGAGCCTGAAAAAQWLADAELRWVNCDPSRVLEALSGRAPEWLGQVAHRLAERRTVAEEEYPLIAQLVSAAGCEPPTTDGFVLGWEVHVPGDGMTIKDSLRDDPFLTVMIPRLFEVPEAGSYLQYAHGWPEALAGLAEEGLLSREMLIDGCLSRLLRGGRLGIVKGFLALLTALDLTEDERAAHTLTWVRMVPNTPALTAGRAQEVLAGLDEAGRLESEHLVEASRAALFRPEKKIVRAQLAMLDKAMRRERSRTDELLPVAAEAFGHEEHSLQERSLALAVRHRKHASGAVLAELAASAPQLAPDLRTRADEVFGDAIAGNAVAGEGTDAPAAESDTLPPVPSAERLEPAHRTCAELAEEVGALLRGHGTQSQQERALNGLVVHAHADLAALRAALEPVVAQQRRAERRELGYRSAAIQGWHWLYCVVLSVMGTASANDLGFISRQAQDNQCPHSAFRSVPRIRAAEIGARMSDDPLPFLLATPTWSTGTIDPSELVERLVVYERSGTEPGQADFDQALLRLDREVPPEARAAAAKLTSPAGRRLAAWLASGGLPDPAVSRTTGPLRPGSPHTAVLVRTEAVPGYEDRPEPFRSLLGAHDPVGSPCTCGGDVECSPDDFALLPQHREIIAGRMLLTFAGLTEREGVGGDARVLPALAESGGPAGPATHLLLAYGLGARRVEEQLFAVDAMLVLAARGQLDTDQLGLEIAELTHLRRLKPQRFAATLREAAGTGAHATVWAVLSAAIPLLLRGEAPHGLTAVLTVAAECAERCGARGAIQEVNEVAARSGSSQLVRQARRIRSVTAQQP
ncbi:DUF6493 family protein [Streptomyces sp. NPDC102441]|uniref:DUF7824 domain-containing protein n=1 Tax=Streptomyces sp. NPDC102441 TaxID=3366176 RepID=UPI003805B301